MNVQKILKQFDADNHEQPPTYFEKLKIIINNNKIIIISVIPLIISIFIWFIISNYNNNNNPEEIIIMCSVITKLANQHISNIKSSIIPILPISSSSCQCTNLDFENKLLPYLEIYNNEIKIITSKIDLSQCIKDIDLNLINPLIHDLKNENQKLCKFNWVSNEWSDCQGTCPQIKKRQVFCSIDNDTATASTTTSLPSSCCIKSGLKPNEIEPCGMVYKWDTGIWGECSSDICGIMKRQVNCVGCDGLLVDDYKCKDLTKELDITLCNIKYSWRTGEWVMGECKRNGRLHTGIKMCHFNRDVNCYKCDETISVDDSKCDINTKPDSHKHIAV